MQRLRNIYNAFTQTHPQPPPKHHLQLTFPKNSETHFLPIYKSTDCFYFRAEDLANIRTAHLSRPLKHYDSSLGNTICADSEICFIDGEKSILTYRGYPIEQLAAKSSYLETAFLLIYGELPDKKQLDSFTNSVMEHSVLSTQTSEMMKTFRYDAHPMGIVVSILATLSAQKSALDEISDPRDPRVRNKAIFMLLGVLPTIAANSYRIRIGRHQNQPNKDLGYIQNFLYMIDHLSEKKYVSHPKLVRAFEVLFIIHAEHEVNCSTALLRQLIGGGSNIFSAVSAAAGALYGPRHGGANASVIHMLQEIGSISNINKFLLEVKQKKRILYGFGHRVYKTKDPRAMIAKKVALDVFEVCGKEPLIEVALQIEKIASEDDFFVTRRIYPNVDFYNGLIYRAMGFPTDMYPVLFVLPLLAGWLAHWNECQRKGKVEFFPSQAYAGRGTREFRQMSERKQTGADIECTGTSARKRRQAHRDYSKGQEI